MKIAKRISRALALFVALACATATAQEDAVILDHVDGLAGPDKIETGRPITFYFRFEIVTARVSGSTNGHEIYSPEGATWGSPTIDTVHCEVEGWYDLVVSLAHVNVDGEGVDTVGFGGAALGGLGPPVGYDEPIYKISTEVFSEDAGKTLCIDSCWYPPGCEWVWTVVGVGHMVPAWYGPLCFEIVPCCVGIRGNVDDDPYDAINIADIGYLVDYLFFAGPAPPCFEEGDVGGGGGISVVEIVYLIEYLFYGGLPPLSCP